MGCNAIAKEMFLFAGISDRQTEAFLSDERIFSRSYRSGEMIYDSDSFAPLLGLVLSGSVRVERRIEDRVVPMRVTPRGGVFGVASLFGGEGYVTLIRAKSKTEVLFFPQEVVQQILLSSPRAAMNYIAFLSEKVRYLNSRIDFYTAGGAKEKLYGYLTRIADEEGIAKLPVSLSALAGQLDMGRASLYRAIDALIADEKIHKTEDGYQIMNH